MCVCIHVHICECYARSRGFGQTWAGTLCPGALKNCSAGSRKSIRPRVAFWCLGTTSPQRWSQKWYGSGSMWHFLHVPQFMPIYACLQSNIEQPWSLNRFAPRGRPCGPRWLKMGAQCERQRKKKPWMTAVGRTDKSATLNLTYKGDHHGLSIWKSVAKPQSNIQKHSNIHSHPDGRSPRPSGGARSNATCPAQRCFIDSSPGWCSDGIFARIPLSDAQSNLQRCWGEGLPCHLNSDRLRLLEDGKIMEATLIWQSSSCHNRQIDVYIYICTKNIIFKKRYYRIL